MSPGSNQGQINVHPGFDGSYNTLFPPATLGFGNTTPASAAPNPLYAYDLQTDWPVGVACANNPVGYNCILAWDDRGTPQGDVLYTFFAINTVANTVSWEGNAYTLANARPAAGVQASYTGGAFRLTWKEGLGAEQVVEAQSINFPFYGYQGQWSTTELDATGIVDPPTYLYHSHYFSSISEIRNHALAYTVQ